jgi:hypothetical protein
VHGGKKIPRDITFLGGGGNLETGFRILLIVILHPNWGTTSGLRGSVLGVGGPGAPDRESLETGTLV